MVPFGKIYLDTIFTGFDYRISTQLPTGTQERKWARRIKHIFVKMVEIWTEITTYELLHHADAGLSLLSSTTKYMTVFEITLLAYCF